MSVLSSARSDTANAAGFFALDLQIAPVQTESKRLQPRNGSISTTISDFGLGYQVELSIGTPKQNIRMTLSTTSPLFMVVDQSSTVCDLGTCLADRLFRSNSSTTYLPQGNYTASQESGLRTIGTVARESFSLGGTEFNDVSVLVSRGGNMSNSILGLGHIGVVDTMANYSHLPYQMYSRGLIGYWGYSLFLDHTNATNPGRLLLGGVDTARFYGRLEALPISNDDQTYGHFTVPLTSITFWDGMTNHSFASSMLDIVPEVGTSAFQLPSNIVQQLARYLGATFQGNIYQYTHSKVNESATINLQFGSSLIRVPLSDMWYDHDADTASLNLFETKGRPTLGLPLFRNAYTVFDYARSEFGIAPLRHNATSASVVPMTTHGFEGIQGYTPNSGSPSARSPHLGLILGLTIGLGVPLLLTIAILIILRRRYGLLRPKSVRRAPGQSKWLMSKFPRIGKRRARVPATGSRYNISTAGTNIAMKPYNTTVVTREDTEEQAAMHSRYAGVSNLSATNTAGGMTGPQMPSRDADNNALQSTRPALHLDIPQTSFTANSQNFRRKPVPMTQAI